MKTWKKKKKETLKIDHWPITANEWAILHFYEDFILSTLFSRLSEDPGLLTQEIESAHNSLNHKVSEVCHLS
jgi:hypothetical protein